MHRRSFPLAAAGLLMVSAGCATVGKEFPDENVRRIRIGVTTRAELKAMFGDPWRTGIENGTETWTYGRYKYRLLGQTDTKDLVVRFDDNGVVRSYSFNTTEAPE